MKLTSTHGYNHGYSFLSKLNLNFPDRWFGPGQKEIEWKYFIPSKNG